MTIDDGNAEANIKTDKTVKKRGQEDKANKTGESSKENKPMKNDVLKDKLLRAIEV